MELTPETVLQNRYRIIRQLGQGGMGMVYLAFDSSVEHEVAVKLNRNVSADATTQFIREARLLANLHHPNLPRVTDYFLIGDSQFLVMDFVPGDDLGTVIEKQGAFTLDQVLHWAEQLGSALTYMHGQNPPVVHRDIKPQNIKLTPEGDVVLVDFGIAKASDSSQMTATGAMGLTPGYAPPEQYGAGRTGPYSDQYAFAATLFTLLTGIKPADSVQRVLGQAILTPINQLIPGIPRHVQVAIERAMAVRPEDRFSSIPDFLHALNEVTAASPTRMSSPAGPSGFEPTVSAGSRAATVAGSGAPLAPTGRAVPPALPAAAPRRRHIPGWVWGVVAAVVIFGGIIVVAGGAGLFFLSNSRLATGQTATALAIARRAPSATRQADAATLAPEATSTRALTATSRPPSATVAAVATNTATEAATATLTPAPIDGGGVIAFASDREDGKTLQIWTMKPYLDSSGIFFAGDFTQLTTGAGDKTQPDWSPDGKKLLYVALGSSQTQGLDIYMLDVSTPGSQPVDISKHQGDDTDPAWSPDGKLIAFTGNSRGDGILQLYLMNADGSNLHRISTDYMEYSPTWQPDMQWLVFVINASDNRYLYRRFEDTGFSYMTSTPSAYDSAEIFGRFGQVEHPQISANGTMLTYVQIKGTSRQIFTADYKKRGAQFSKLTTAGNNYDPAWSADSQMLVFTSERDSNSEIYIMTAAGLLQTNLTNRQGKDMQPAWQP